MGNEDKIILDLCGGTGSWSKPYREHGYDVRLITLPETDVLTYKPPDNVYGILAAPPCTMFSMARTTAKTPRDLKKGMECVIACLNIVWSCRYKEKLKFWALENPKGYLKQFLGQAPFIFQPYEFGDYYSKETFIWGYFNIPRKPSQTALLRKVKLGDCSKWNWGDRNVKQPARKAMTPPGFAKAFFKVNR